MDFWLLIVIALTWSNVTQAQTILRQNYGTSFKQLLKTRIYTHTWIHDFVIDLPRYDPARLTAVNHILSERSNNCDSIQNVIDSAICRDDMATLSGLQQLRYASVNSLHAAIAKIHAMLPPATFTNHLRTTKRAVIAGVGSGMHWLFGTATDDEIDAEEKHIEHVEAAVKLTQDAILKQSEHFASFAKVEGTHFDILKTALTAENHTIANLFQVVRSLARTHGERRPYIAQALQMIRMFVTMHDQTYELLGAVESLAQGSISPALIQPAVVAKVLRFVASDLHDNYGANLVWTNENDFYRTKRFAYHRVGLNLHLRVGFPVSFMDDESRLYAVSTFPMSVPNNTLTTQLADQPRYFLTVDNLTRRRRAKIVPFLTNPHPFSFFEYSAEFHEMPRLDEDDLLDLTDAEITLRPYGAQTCLSAIFLNQVSNVNTFCPFKATPGFLRPNTLEIAPATVLLQNTSTYRLRCHDHDGTYGTIATGCNDTCLVTLPCRCSLLTKVTFIPERFAGCINDTNTTMVHTVNLHALSLFFNKEDLIEIHAASTFNSTPRIDFPDLSPLYANLSKNDNFKYAADDISLAKIAATAHLEAATYSALVDGALAGVATQTFNTSFTQQLWWYANVIGLCILAICVCLIFWLTRRVRHLTFILTALQLVRPSHGLQLTYQRTTPDYVVTDPIPINYANDSNSPFNTFRQLWYDQWTDLAIDEVKLLQIIVALLITAGLIKMFTYFRRQWNQRSTPIYFALEFGNEQLATIIPLIPLHHPANHYTFHEGDGLQTAHVSGLFLPKLCLSWPNIHMINTTTTFATEVNVAAIRLSWPQARRCRQILRQNYYVLPCTYTLNNEHTYLQWADATNAIYKPMAKPTARPILARLYPSLPMP